MRVPVLLLVIMLGLLLGAPSFSQDPMLTDANATLVPPSSAHLLGTDYLGRDVFSRVIYGGQRTLLITSMATLLALLTGLLLGLLAGFAVSILDTILQAILNALLALPPLVLALVILTLLGQSVLALIVATGLAQTAHVARVMRIAVQSVRTREYVLAAHAQGAAPWHVIRWHILPSLQPILGVYTIVIFSYCLFNSAALSVLGLGGAPGVPDWGVMLAEGRHSFRAAPWVALAPGLAITLVIFCLNALVDYFNQH